tara:strand:- start:1088 stop:1342 length:255 start_codon:yes stop_codon:yes gene_type:complete
MKKKWKYDTISDDIIAEQYVEVCFQNDGTWDVELVIENIVRINDADDNSIRILLGNFETMKDGDGFADALRFHYDKSIFKYELM